MRIMMMTMMVVVVVMTMTMTMLLLLLMMTFSRLFASGDSCPRAPCEPITIIIYDDSNDKRGICRNV